MKTPSDVTGKTVVSPTSARSLKRRQAASLGLGLAGLTAVALLPATGGCLNRPIQPVEPRTTSTIIERITQTGVDKIDILLMIDNSASMADKQAILAAAVPELVNRLVDPNCVDPMGVVGMTPTDPSAMCAAGFQREFKSIGDINIGIVDTSLGGMGSDACPDNAAGYQNNDHSHLIVRPAASPTYMSEGFLAWDGAKKRSGITDATALKTQLQTLVTGVGQTGCGYEQPLETVVRFLVDPKPYLSLTKTGTNVTPTGVDQPLLDQRAQFLRSDSLLAIIVLTDENDFSINFLNPNAYLPWNSSPFYRASSACAANPADKCCYSCGLGAPAGCPAKTSDPSCSMNGGLYTPQEDGINLKEDQPKKKYGFDPNFPIKRYVNAFSQIQIDPTRPDLSVPSGDKNGVPNPIFQDLSMKGQPVRTPDLVFFAAIVGVPYQAVAVNPADISKGFQTFDQLTASKFWDAYVGDPDNYVAPTNPIMQESTAPRMGIPTAPVIPPTAAAPNGGDRALDPASPTDIQQTCIFQLATPNPMGVDCATPDSNNNPLCTMTGGKPGEPQIYAKAYPGVRELAVVHGLAGQGIAASICPANPTDQTNAATFGYNPAVGSIIDRLKAKLGGQCLPRQLFADPLGNVPCRIIEAAHLPSGQSDCKTPAGRKPLDPTDPAIEAAKSDPLAPTGAAAWNSFCELVQLPGLPTDMTSQKYQCQNTVDANLPTSGLDGWCYIDAASTPPVGSPAIVANCPANDKRLIRFVGTGAAQPGATALITCSGDTAK